MAVRGIEPNLTRQYRYVRLHAVDLDHIVAILREDGDARGDAKVTIEVEGKYVVDDVSDLENVAGGRIQSATISSRGAVLVLMPRASQLRMVRTDHEQSHVTFNRLDTLLARSRVRLLWSTPARDWLGFVALMMPNYLVLYALLSAFGDKKWSPAAITALTVFEALYLAAVVIVSVTLTGRRKVILMRAEDNWLRRRAQLSPR